MATINAINTLWRRMCVFVCVCVWPSRDHSKSTFLADKALCVCVKSRPENDNLHFSLSLLWRRSRNRCHTGTQKHTHTRRGTLQRPVKTQIKSANVETWVDLFQLQLKSLCVFVWPFEIATPCNSAKHKIRPCFIDFFVILSYITS